MNTYLSLFLEFFKIGLFAIGGGPATLPFLMELTKRHDWFTLTDLTNMLAVSQSTPGPLGINMATYGGFNAGGILGGIVATLSLVLPSIIVIIIVAHFLKKFKENPTVQNVFWGIRPAVTAMIASAVVNLFMISLVKDNKISWPMVALCVITFGLMNLKQLKKLHPAVWLLVAAVIGIVFKF